jgi:Transglycosylase SLT domain
MDDIFDTIANVAAQNGIDPAFALAVAERESSFNPNAHASKTIDGLFQMSSGLRQQYGIGNSKDPAVQTQGWSSFINDAKGQLRNSLGREPTNGELYLAHYWGPQRAASVINGAHSDLSPADVFTPRELAENPNLAKGKTVGGLASNIINDIDRRTAKFGGQSGSLSAFGQPDDEDKLQTNFDRNKAWTKQGASNFNTDLGDKEQPFRQWLTDNKVPFDPDQKGANDYDMRGFYQALQNGDPQAKSAIDPNDGKMHYPDYWKTPYHETFSNQSQWAAPNAPSWNDKDQLIGPDGKMIFDDRAKPINTDAPDSKTPFAAFGSPTADTTNQNNFSQFGSSADEPPAPLGDAPTSGLGGILSSALKSATSASSASADDTPPAPTQPSYGQEVDPTQYFKVAGIPATPGAPMTTQNPQQQQQQQRTQQSAYVPQSPSSGGDAQSAFLGQG